MAEVWELDDDNLMVKANRFAQVFSEHILGIEPSDPDSDKHEWAPVGGSSWTDIDEDICVKCGKRVRSTEPIEQMRDKCPGRQS